MCRVILVLAMISVINLGAQQWERIVDLRGHWKLEIGDDPRWADPKFDDSQWQKIFVPSPWEDEGFPGYDGYAWYRKHFEIPKEFKGEALYLHLGRIDDVDEVFINGKFFAFSGQFPPDYITAYNIQRQYYIPMEYLNFSGSNVLAVRVFDEQLAGGIVEGKIGLYVPKNYLSPDINLRGEWKFHIGDDMEWKEENYPDEHWETIQVPSFWETQGYKGYDGFGWYRRRFVIAKKYAGQKLILLLGKIDDLDEVYLNGHQIGKTGKIYDDPDRISPGNHYAELRAYFIPEKYLYVGAENTLAVRVYDGWMHGGIYEGPIGIVGQDRYLSWQREQEKGVERKFRSIWDLLFPGRGN